MWRLVVACLLPVLGIAQGGQAQEVRPIRVAVAANLRDPFQEIAARFVKQHRGARVEPVFTASGSAHQQIIQGAPFDLFLSGDSDFPASLVRRGLAEPGTLRIYARGNLGLWVSNRVTERPNGLSVLEGARVRRVATANPETAPYGRAAMQALAAAGLRDRVQSKLVFGQDVGQTAQMALAAADAAFLPVSYLLTPAFRDTGRIIRVDAGSYAPLDQAYLIIRGRARPEVRAFYHFLQTPTARAVLRRHGYEVP